MPVTPGDGHRTGDDDWSARFPALFAETHVAYANCQTRLTTEPVPDHLVARLHLVAVTPDGEVVVCRSDRGWQFLPGGTREPAESLGELARRELMEEAGAVPDGEPVYLAAHIVDSGNVRPYRPHLPHPRAYWSYAVVGVSVVGPPTNPPDGEAVVEVLTLPPEQAAARLDGPDPIHAGIVRLADAMGLIRRPGQE
jgi:8-oxo-dGTP diphosphatase